MHDLALVTAWIIMGLVAFVIVLVVLIILSIIGVLMLRTWISG